VPEQRGQVVPIERSGGATVGDQLDGVVAPAV